MSYFKSLNLHESLLNAIKSLGFEHPTPIQEQALPLALQKKDILGTAQTGTGKTGAFGIPLANFLLNSPLEQGLILTPTRELAAQVYDVMKQLLGKSFYPALLVGGAPIFKQIAQLKRRPQLLIGTPGRINDLINRKAIRLENVRTLVLDEVDRMLDIGFKDQLDDIVEFLPKERHTMMFSATLSPEVLKTANLYLNNPERISVGSINKPLTKITQESIKTTPKEKFTLLQETLTGLEGSSIVFVKTKRGCDEISGKLEDLDFSCVALHGDLPQRKRSRVIDMFRKGSKKILIATDVASRGLDISLVECVINFDLPQVAEDYIHRIGRTGRANRDGAAINFLTNEDRLKWMSICKLMDPENKENLYKKELFPARSSGESSGGSRSSSYKGNNNRRAPYGNSFGRSDRSSEPRTYAPRKDFSERRTSAPFERSERSSEPRTYAPRKDFSERRTSSKRSERSSEPRTYAPRKDFSERRTSSPFTQNSERSFKKPFGPKKNFTTKREK